MNPVLILMVRNMGWSKSTRVVLCGAAAIFALYVPIFWWLKTSYEPTDRVIDLRRPYSKTEIGGFAFDKHRIVVQPHGGSDRPRCNDRR